MFTTQLLAFNQHKNIYNFIIFFKRNQASKHINLHSLDFLNT